MCDHQLSDRGGDYVPLGRRRGRRPVRGRDRGSARGGARACAGAVDARQGPVHGRVGCDARESVGDGAEQLAGRERVRHVHGSRQVGGGWPV